MSTQKTTTDVEALKINYLTQQMYRDAVENNEIEADELYMSPYTLDYWREDNLVLIDHMTIPDSTRTNLSITSIDFVTPIIITIDEQEYLCPPRANLSNDFDGGVIYTYDITNSDINMSFGIALYQNILDSEIYFKLLNGTMKEHTLTITYASKPISVSSDFKQTILSILDGGNN